MPSHRLKGKRIVLVQGLEAFTNRAYRFRKDNNIPDWNTKGGTGKQRARKQEEVMARMARGYEEEEEEALRQDEESEAESASGDDNDPLHGSSPAALDSVTPSQQIPNLQLPATAGHPRQNRNLPRRLHRESLPAHVQPIFDRQMELEQARGTPAANIRLVPLFATPEARGQAYLNNRTFNSPWRVARAWREGDVTATGGHLVIRPHNAPRAVDPETGEVQEDVADLTTEEIESLREADEADQFELDWFDG